VSGESLDEVIKRMCRKHLQYAEQHTGDMCAVLAMYGCIRGLLSK
jgi:hypothetical protein